MTATIALAAPALVPSPYRHWTTPVPARHAACGQGAPARQLTTLPGWVTCPQCRLLLQRAADAAAAEPCHEGTPMPVNCSCHINPPCGVCETSEYCNTCGELYFPESEGLYL